MNRAPSTSQPFWVFAARHQDSDHVTKGQEYVSRVSLEVDSVRIAGPTDPREATIEPDPGRADATDPDLLYVSDLRPAPGTLSRIVGIANPADPTFLETPISIRCTERRREPDYWRPLPMPIGERLVVSGILHAELYEFSTNAQREKPVRDHMAPEQRRYSLEVVDKRNADHVNVPVVGGGGVLFAQDFLVPDTNRSTDDVHFVALQVRLNDLLPRRNYRAV